MTQAPGPARARTALCGARGDGPQRKGRVVEDGREFNVGDAGRAALRALGIALGSVMVSACATLQASEAAKPEPSAAETAASTGKPARNACPGGIEAGHGRNCSGRGDAAWCSAPVCRDREGREGRPGPISGLAERRQDMDRDPDRHARQAFFPVDQHESRHRRAHAVCGADGQPRRVCDRWGVCRRVPQGRRQHPADRTQHDIHSARRLAGRASGAQVVLRQPAVLGPGRQRTAPGTQVGPGRGECAAAHGYSARIVADRAQLSQYVYVRRTQLVYRVGKEQP